MKKRKKQKKNKMKKIVILILVVLVLAVSGIYVKQTYFSKKKVTEVKVVDKLEKYDYSVSENATEYYKNLFKELKTVLNKDEVDEEKYAKLLSQLFLADYFNLDNKISKNDVGGVQFVYKDYQETFVKLSTESVYKYVESNIYGNRKQELPVIKNVEVTDVTTGEFEYGDKVDEKAYVVELAISYEKDLGYQTSATLTLIHSNNKLEIAKMS